MLLKLPTVKPRDNSGVEVSQVLPEIATRRLAVTRAELAASFSSTKTSTLPASTTVAPWHSTAKAAVAPGAALDVLSAMRRPVRCGRHSLQQLSKVLWVTGTGRPATSAMPQTSSSCAARAARLGSRSICAAWLASRKRQSISPQLSFTHFGAKQMVGFNAFNSSLLFTTQKVWASSMIPNTAAICCPKPSIHTATSCGHVDVAGDIFERSRRW
mmetsp:Transcript_5710/g.9755  ORF Transcript_5710/g.9755 Transcript_5710/m.9755 type:complete len:214 (-) Transcript_5710:45-686(-)